MTRRWALVLTAGFLTAGMAACGGSSSKGSSPSTTASGAGSTAATDQAEARAALLVVSDFPAGWTPTPHKSNGSSSDGSTQLRQCAGEPANEADTVESHSPDFKMGDQLEVDSSTNIKASAAVAERALAGIKGPRFIPCAKAEFEKIVRDEAAGQQATVGALSFTPLDIGHHGDGEAGFRIAVPLTAQGQTITLTLDLALVRSGAVERTYSFVGTGAVFDPALEQALLDKADARVAAA